MGAGVGVRHRLGTQEAAREVEAGVGAGSRLRHRLGTQEVAREVGAGVGMCPQEQQEEAGVGVALGLVDRLGSGGLRGLRGVRGVMGVMGLRGLGGLRDCLGLGLREEAGAGLL